MDGFLLKKFPHIETRRPQPPAAAQPIPNPERNPFSPADPTRSKSIENGGRCIPMKKYLLNIFKGLLVGASMLIPGVSGGTMAIILNTYDDLLAAVSHFFQSPKKHFLMLATFSCGGLLGIFLFSKPILTLTERFRFPMLFLFLGAILGGIPALWKKAEIRSFRPYQILWPILGILFVTGLSLIPDTLFTNSGGGFVYLLLLVLAGVLAAVALILPGISLSYMLLVLGLYEPTMTAIHQLDFPFLLPMGLGLAAGTLLMVKALEKAMVSYPKVTYPVIIGFLLGSLPAVFPGIPTGIDWLICPLTLAAGFSAVWFLSRITSD